jgi:hypothetical protein
MVNISQNTDLVKMSKETIAPLEYVPDIILYINGKPFIKYNGAKTENDIKNFIVEVSKNLNNKQHFSNPQQKQEDEAIPGYCLGVPKCDGDVCYLTYENAYGK